MQVLGERFGWIGFFRPCFARQKNYPSVAACLDGCKRSLLLSRADNQGGRPAEGKECAYLALLTVKWMNLLRFFSILACTFGEEHSNNPSTRSDQKSKKGAFRRTSRRSIFWQVMVYCICLLRTAPSSRCRGAEKSRQRSVYSIYLEPFTFATAASKGSRLRAPRSARSCRADDLKFLNTEHLLNR